MDDDSNKKIIELEQKIDAVYRSVEKTRKMFMWTLIITLVMIIVPLIALFFVIPVYISNLDLGGLL